MSPETWQRIQAVLQQALELPTEARTAFLDDVCAGDSPTRERVERLLDADRRPLRWLDTPVFDAAPELLRDASFTDAPLVEASTPAAGRRIGPYEIVRELGRGGMGIVVLARRADEQYHQQVAIKLLRGDLSGPRSERRFLQERQILASLEHPHIARLLGGDVTEDGVPYLVMEYVEGERIDAYCRRLELPLTARLELFRQVCSAVGFAHRHLVVHCDLKPSNVLVTRAGVPKLLDFGIARLLGEDFVPRLTTATTGRWPMTPEFASPEQIRGERLTVASDVYSLGVMLHLLLTDHLPYRLEGCSPREIERRVCEREPPPPSLACGDAPSPGRRRRSLAGDLDTIVAMALRKDPSRRYGSVEQLSEDLRRHRTGLPVLARKDTSIYRASKFVRRHRLGLAAAALVIAALSIGIRVADRERAQAVRERVRAGTVAGFLTRLFEDTDSSGEMSAGALFAQPGARAAQEVLLDEGARRIPLELSEQPALQARLMQVVGDAYRNLGSLGKARRQLQGSFEIRSLVFGLRSLQTSESLDSLCLLDLSDGDLERAETRCRETLAIRRQSSAATPVQLAESLNSLALVLRAQGRLDDAETRLRESLRLRQLHLPDKDPGVTTGLNNLAVVLQAKRSYGEAERLFREVLRRKLERYGTHHLQVVNSYNNLASLLQDLARTSRDEERYREAEDLYRKALDIGSALSAEPHPLVATVEHNLGTLRVETGRPEEAVGPLETALRLDRGLFGEEHPDVARDLNSLAVAAFRRGRLEQAGEYFSQALEIFRRTLGEGHPRFRSCLFSLVTLWLQLGRDGSARSLLESTLAVWRRSPPREAWALPQAAVMLGGSLLAAGRPDEAEPLLEGGFEGLCGALGADNRLTRQAAARRIELYEAQGREIDAERSRQGLASEAPACPSPRPSSPP